LRPVFERRIGRKRLRPIFLVSDGDGRPAIERCLNITISELLKSSLCIPKEPELEISADSKDTDNFLDLLESTKTEAKSLNILTLQRYTSVQIIWVSDISRHLMLSERTGRCALELFAFPEIISLSSPLKPTHPFVHYGGWAGHLLHQPSWCICSSCVVLRIIEKDKALHQQDCKAIFRCLKETTESWNLDDFRILWPRIVKLRDFQDHATPASWWAWWKDRRDPVRYYGTL
jgi:hypothetical protein